MEASSSINPFLIDQLKESIKIFSFTSGTGINPKANGQLQSKTFVFLSDKSSPQIFFKWDM